MIEESSNEDENESSLQHADIPISIVIAPHDNDKELEENLPVLLSQEYKGEYRVIVIAEKGDALTENVLKRLKGNEHLYVSFIPQSSRYMSRRKLAITLGVKAAKTEWVILTDATCRPDSNHWLSSMASHISDNTSMVIGYSNYADDSRQYQRFERVQMAYYLFREDLKGNPYRTQGRNIAFRKSKFIEQEGFRGSLQDIRGEYDFLVNKYAVQGECAIAVEPDAWLTEQKPTKKEWLNRHLYYISTRRLLSRGGWHKALVRFDTFTLHANYLLIIASMVFAGLTERWILLGSSVLALLITIIMRTIFANKALKFFDAKISVWRIIFYEIGVYLHRVSYVMHYKCADKNDFTSHKL